ncbi:MAG: YqaJ viral recombinase family protein, partial [Bacteroidia bacterium]|nr:YqaJ viral recombinase family protein [Bacteroidia bacterium]
MKLTQTKPIKLISIGGSSIAAVLGLSRFTTPYQKWLLLTGRKSSEDSPSLRRGVIAERFISEYAVSEGLVSIYESQKYISFGAANGTIDAIGDYQGERVIIEFKSSAYIKAADDVPNDYRLQCVWY